MLTIDYCILSSNHPQTLAENVKARLREKPSPHDAYPQAVWACHGGLVIDRTSSGPMFYQAMARYIPTQK